MQRAAPAFWLFIAAAVGAALSLWAEPPLLPLVVLLAASAALAASGREAARALGVLCVAALLTALVAAHANLRHAQRSERLPHAITTYEGVVTQVSSTRSTDARLIVDVTGVIPDSQAVERGMTPTALALRLSVMVPAGTDVVAPGDRVRFRGVARAPAPASAPGEFNGKAFALARNLDGHVSLRSPADLAVMERGASFLPFASMRSWLSARIQSLSTPREAGLVLALVVGDTSLFEPDQLDAYRNVGAGHLLAVSGLQVSLLALLFRALWMFVLVVAVPWVRERMPLPAAWRASWRTSGGRSGGALLAASVLSLLCVAAFVGLCGAPPSALRAGLMAAAVLSGGLVSRRVRALDAIGLAGLATLLLSPASVLDPSFLLSYGAVFGLALAPRTQAPDHDVGGAAHVKHLVRTTVVATVAASMVTLPISAALFGQLSLAGLLANVVLVPIASIAQVPAIGLSLLGAWISAVPLPGELARTMGGLLVWLGAQAALLLEALVVGLADLLGGLLWIEAPSAWVASLLVAAAAVLLVLVGRGKLGAAAVLVGAVAVSLVVAARPDGGVSITVIPVGQGDATLIQFENGQVMLIDGGGVLVGRDPGEAIVVPTLRRKGVRSIDVLVLSHPHPDHGNGLVAVARAFPVRELWHNGAPADAFVLAHLLAALPRTTTVRSTPELLGDHAFGAATVSVLAPAPAERTAQYAELGANDNSVVLRICQGTCALWAGDLERFGEELLLDSVPSTRVHAELVKAPHHGSNTSSTDRLVAATGARHVVFCTGRDNSFGFPHAEVIGRWRATNAKLWDTAVNGQIHANLKPDGVRIRAYVSGEVEAPPEG